MAPSASPRSRRSPWLGAALLLLVAGLWHLLLPHLAPQLAVDAASEANYLLDENADFDWPADPWGQRWHYAPSSEVQRFSSGPNRVDEGGAGDDLLVTRNRPWGAPRPELLERSWGLIGLGLLPFVLGFGAWVWVLRIARRARERSLGWRELGWALLCGGPAAAVALSYAWWGAGNAAWRSLLTPGQQGLVGWRLSFSLTVAGALFVLVWALSRPPRRDEEVLEPPAEGEDRVVTRGG